MNQRRGATLQELLVAIFVFGFCLVALLVPFPSGTVKARVIQDARGSLSGKTAGATNIQKVIQPNLPASDSSANSRPEENYSLKIEIVPTLLPSTTAMPGRAGANTTGLMSAPGTH